MLFTIFVHNLKMLIIIVYLISSSSIIFPAITEEEFNSQILHLRSSAKGSPGSSNVDIQIPLPSTMSSPPSPQSLMQQHTNYPESDPDFNPHKKLAHVSSVSAPEVNQVRWFCVVLRLTLIQGPKIHLTSTCTFIIIISLTTIFFQD